MNSSVLVVEDDSALRQALVDSIQVSGYQTMHADSAESAINLMTQGHRPDMIVTDVQMGKMSGIDFLKNLRQSNADLPVILMTAYSDIQDAVAVMKLGACDYLQKPFEASRLNHLIDKYLTHHQSSEIIVEDKQSKKLFEFAKKIATTDANVLLAGPSGSGKEVMSRFIHSNSLRTNQPFVAINCAAIPENMLEATLFGYEKGAFTGAHQACAGKFEQAQKGTLLLDEISEMDLSLQAKLLRVIQEKEVERLGGKKLINLDIRLIATTNRDLKKEVEEKRFREDLYYRLNVFPIHCLALNERPDDIVPLAESLLAKYHGNSHAGLSLSVCAKAKLVAYLWPGNVRELDNLMQRVCVLSNGEVITADEIKFENESGFEQSSEATQKSFSTKEGQLGSDLQNHEFQLIIDALIKHQGKKSDVAESLGISPRTLRYKLAKMRELGYQLPTKGDY